MSLLDQTFWVALFRALTIEAGCVVLVALLLSRIIQSACWRRALWQATVICLLLLTASELSGFGRGLAGFASRPRTGQRQEMRSASAVSPSVYLQPMPVVFPRSQPMPPPVMIWWPGLLWLAGFAVVLGRVVVAQLLFAVLRRRWPEIINNDFNRRSENMRSRFGYRRKVRLLQASSLVSSIAFGVIRPAIALPPDFAEQFSPATQEAVLAHELAHLAARDPAWYLLAEMASALLWWHPLVWWARRQLHRHCELAADQATAVVPDGPVRLAECLVSLGKRMTTQRRWGLMGVTGGGFGSNLGERVESLVKLADGAWKPLRGWRVGVLKVGGTIMLAGMVVCLCGWVEGPSVFEESWRDSAASAFLMAALDTNQSSPPVPSPEIQRQKIDIAAKVANAKLMFETGKYDEAQSLLTQVLKDDPSNKSAKYYLNLVKEARAAAQGRAPRGIPNAPTDGRHKILSKLNRIRFSEVSYKDLPLTEVIKRLRVESQKRDPDGAGINFMINPHAGALAGGITSEEYMSDITVKIDPPLHDLRLVDVLDAITKTASQSIRYTVEDYAVVFLPSDALYTKVFKVDPNTFVQGLQNVRSINLNPGTQSSGRGSGGDSGTSGTGVQIPGVQVAPATPGGRAGLSYISTNTTPETDALVKAYFTAAGVDLSPPKVVFFNDRLGQMMVRATLSDLEIIQQAVEMLNPPLGQLMIEMDFVDMDETALRDLGLGWTDPAKEFSRTMTPAEFRSALAVIKQRTDADVRSAPKVKALSGRQVHFGSVGGEWSRVIDVMPTVSADGFAIQMVVKPTMLEFMIEDNSAGVVSQSAAATGSTNFVQLAAEGSKYQYHYQVRHMVKDFNVWDGQTAVVGGMLSILPSEAGKAATKKVRIVFVTPRIIDGAGNPVHADDELARRTGIPGQ